MTAPRRTLVVIDVQNEYFTGQLPIEHPPVATSLPNILAAMDAATAAGIPVVKVQHLAPAGAPIFNRGTPGFELHAEVARRPHALAFEKTQASVFAGTGFADWVREQAIDTLTIVGYMTHNCDLATVMHAAQLGLKAEVLSDASGSLPYANAAGRASAEEIHRVVTVVLNSNFAGVGTTAQWQAAVAAGQALPVDNVFLSNQRGRAG